MGRPSGLSGRKKENEMNPKITRFILLVVVIALIVFDIFVAADSTTGNTISEVTLSIARKHPVLPFCIGIVCGHLFWPQKDKIVEDR